MQQATSTTPVAFTAEQEREIEAAVERQLAKEKRAAQFLVWFNECKRLRGNGVNRLPPPPFELEYSELLLAKLNRFLELT